jgi:phosphoribosylformylglycinamidine synthase I
VRWGVVTFPGSNDDHDTARALARLFGDPVERLWHKEDSLRGVDCVVLPGGFSYGDYLRCGAIARFSPIMEAVVRHARAGGVVLGICNGFQVLCESGLLPGALVTNAGQRFVCRDVVLRVDNARSAATWACRRGELLRIPIKHGAGCYVVDDATAAAIERRGQVVLRYVDAAGHAAPEANPNASHGSIAGLCNEDGNVVGMMPHPEHATDPLLGSSDGQRIFQSIRAFVGGRRAEASP